VTNLLAEHEEKIKLILANIEKSLKEFEAIEKAWGEQRIEFSEFFTALNEFREEYRKVYGEVLEEREKKRRAAAEAEARLSKSMSMRSASGSVSTSMGEEAGTMEASQGGGAGAGARAGERPFPRRKLRRVDSLKVKREAAAAVAALEQAKRQSNNTEG
jgi:hypothetical protein